MKKPSRILPGSDASILAHLAQAAHLPVDQDTLTLIKGLSCPFTKQVAKDILAHNTKNPAAKAFLDWVETLESR
jgi:hypothetical protein